MFKLEQQISSIESANINKETLDALSNAGKAMKQIHNGMTLEQVDKTMYVFLCFPHSVLSSIADYCSGNHERNSC